jgi:AcrR family transcriptional regulator
MMRHMSSRADTMNEPRIPLTKGRVFEAAVDLADRSGVRALTMRNVAAELGVEAMSLYYHVANKEALLDGVVDTLVLEIEHELGGFAIEFDDEVGWKSYLRDRILTARRVMLRHPWAPGLIETRVRMTPILLRYMDSLLGILVAGGFSYALGHYAMHALGSRSLGFNQELFVPDDPDAGDDEDAEVMLSDLAPQIPHMVQMIAEIAHDDPDSTLGWCDYQAEFEFALDLILDGLERSLRG